MKAKNSLTIPTRLLLSLGVSTLMSLPCLAESPIGVSNSRDYSASSSMSTHSSGGSSGGSNSNWEKTPCTALGVVRKSDAREGRDVAIVPQGPSDCGSFTRAVFDREQIEQVLAVGRACVGLDHELASVKSGDGQFRLALEQRAVSCSEPGRAPAEDPAIFRIKIERYTGPSGGGNNQPGNSHKSTASAGLES